MKELCNESVIKFVGIDLAKRSFHLYAVDSEGRAVLSRKLTRARLSAVVAQLPACTIAMEACGSAHRWARLFRTFGHEVRLIAPQFVKPYVKSNKNDAADAEAICEAAQRPSMRFVAVKSVEQQDIQAIHRMRSLAVERRTAQIEQIAHGDARARAWMTIPGVGAKGATALRAAVGDDPRRLKNGRGLAAWLGLVPRQHATGGRERLLGIGKRGDVYLRNPLIHGARAVLRCVERKADPTSRWATALKARRHTNVAVVAMANKIARMAYAAIPTGKPDAPAKAALANR
jgi:transposase